MTEKESRNTTVKPTDEYDHKALEKILRSARNQVRALFYWQSLGLVLCLAALLAVQMLQTSINIEGHVGSISVTVGFVTSIFVCIFFCPTILRTLGPTTTLILSEICYLIYCACNFYPELYVLVPGGIFSGIGRALFVPSYSMLIITLTSHCSKYTTSRREEHYFNQLQSRYYSLNEFVQIIGNGLSYAILYSTYDSQELFDNNFNSTNATSQVNSSLFQYCGVNDCQDTAVVEQSIYQYVPPKKSSVYIFLSTTVLLALSGIAVHCIVFPGVGPFSNKLQKIETGVSRKLTVFPTLTSVHDSSSITQSTNSTDVPTKDLVEFLANGNALNGKKLVCCCHEEKIIRKKKCVEIFDTGDANLLEKSLPDERNTHKESEDGYWSTLAKTLFFMVRPTSILLGTATLHCGMQIGFCFADLTRAYASCVAGVHMTGAFAASFGVAGIFSSYLYGKVLPLCGRLSIYCLASMLELVVYAVCYCWTPDPNSLYVVFLIFIGTGIVNGMTRQNLIAAFTTQFPHEKRMALTAFNVAYTGGIGVQYGLSTFMCVSSKITTQVVVTTIGLLFYGIVEACLTRKKKAVSDDEDSKRSSLLSS